MQDCAEAGGAPITDASRRILISDAVAQIAAVLEAKGWPRRATGASATEDLEVNARRDVERARQLWESAEAEAIRNPSLAPFKRLAKSVFDTARRRLDSALTIREAAKADADRLGSDDQAWAELCQASRTGAVKARGILVPAQGTIADAHPIERELPLAAFLYPGSSQAWRLHKEVNAPWGRYIHVNYDSEEIDQLWPMPGTSRQDDAITRSARSETRAGPNSPSVDALAEWIFARYGRERRFNQLYVEARTEAKAGGVVAGFLKKDLLTAHQQVYQTKGHRAPASGWPLQPMFQRRLETKQ